MAGFNYNDLNFDNRSNRISPESITAEMERLMATPQPQIPTVTPLDDILDALLNDIQKVDFDELANPEIIELKKQYNAEQDEDKRTIIKKQIQTYKTTEKEKYVIIIDEIIKLAIANDWDICQSGNSVFVFNGAYWHVLNENLLKQFLGQCAERLGLKPTKAKQYEVKDSLLKQFYSTGFKAQNKSDRILINLKNGTFEVSPDGKHQLKNVDKDDFLTYQLNFEYDKTADCQKFKQFLSEVLPETELQTVLAEYLGYVFIPNLKLEKALFLYGSGANGKSVFFDIVTALFGKENIINNSLSMLCERDDYRAKLANKLVNYASEVGTRINSDIFKQMASNETLTVRELYGKPFEITNYARLIFNANTLPKDTEQTNAYFRRFLIIPFDVTIPESSQNPNLAKEIIRNELAGVFNWVLGGLDRLVRNQRFSECKRSDDVRKQYQLESDSVAMFVSENDYQKSTCHTKQVQEVYNEYKIYCVECGMLAVKRNNFYKRLLDKGFVIEKGAGARVIYIEVKHETPNIEQISEKQVDNKKLPF